MSVAFFNILPKGKPKPFILRIDTTLGDGLNQMRLPIRGTNMNIKWGDGSSQVATQTQQPVSTNWITHTYANAGIYDIEMTNVNWIRFVNTGDMLKPTKIVNWGEYIFTFFANAFQGCKNLELSIDTFPLIASTIGFANAFSLTEFTEIPNETFKNADVINSTAFMFSTSKVGFITKLSLIGLEKTATAFRMFLNCSNLQVGVGVFDDFTTTAYNTTFFGCALNQTSVDNILISINTARLSGIQVGTTRDLGIQGGTSATPSQAGKDATDALRAAGWVVGLNGY